MLEEAQADERRAALDLALLRAIRERLEAGFVQVPNLLRQKRYTRCVHSAVFCEVRVDEALGTVHRPSAS